MTKINTNHATTGKNTHQPRILVAPLDWGLGHATRCIPVIYELMTQGAQPWLAGEGLQEELLRAEFPDLPFLPLKGYRVKYARSAPGLVMNMLLQTPRLLQAIKQEHDWLATQVKEHAIDAVISDNRYGLYHPCIPSIFITHQLRIKTPFGKWSESILQKRNYRYINRFSACWIADGEKEHNLAGELSHPLHLPRITMGYTGPLSRLKPGDIPEKKGHLFISLSGPEPQRSMLEDRLLKEISVYNGSATIVRGLPGEHSVIPSTDDIRFYNHLPSGEFNREMLGAELVIARSGYSTLMDLAVLGKKSVLIPTPGQTEQEYLGKRWMDAGLAVCVEQKNFSLGKALEMARGFNYRVKAVRGEGELRGLVRELVALGRRGTRRT